MQRKARSPWAVTLSCYLNKNVREVGKIFTELIFRDGIVRSPGPHTGFQVSTFRD